MLYLAIWYVIQNVYDLSSKPCTIWGLYTLINLLPKYSWYNHHTLMCVCLLIALKAAFYFSDSNSLGGKQCCIT